MDGSIDIEIQLYFQIKLCICLIHPPSFPHWIPFILRDKCSPSQPQVPTYFHPLLLILNSLNLTAVNQYGSAT